MTPADPGGVRRICIGRLTVDARGLSPEQARAAAAALGPALARALHGIDRIASTGEIEAGMVRVGTGNAPAAIADAIAARVAGTLGGRR